MAESGIGQSLRRKEDKRFLSGHGRYTDDISWPGQCYAYFLRSPHAHARIRSLDGAAARVAPGVIAVYSGADLAADQVGSLPCGWTITDRQGAAHKAPPHYPLARDRARYVGDQVAVVLAETLAQAKDAADLIAVDYEVLQAAVEPVEALKDDSPQVHDEAPGNLCFDWELGDRDGVDQALANAVHVSRLDLINNRVIPNAIEPRAVLSSFDPGTERYTIYTTSQCPHLLRLMLCAFVLGLQESRVEVIAPDVGGGFGSKAYCYAEETVCTWAAGKLKRPVKWTAERSESFLSDAHGRDHVTTVELGLDAIGNFIALKVDTVANLGAYLSSFATAIPTYLYAPMLAGQYRTPLIYANVKAAFTHTAPVDAYRGAGRPEATYLLERIVEVAARETACDPADLRRRNLIAPDAFPYRTPVTLTYDSGSYAAALDKALEMIDYAGYPVRRQSSLSRGKRRGLGFSAYIEACGMAPSAMAGAMGAGIGFWESAQVRFNPTGTVTVLTGSHSHGQGHETTFSQVVSGALGIPVENVEVIQGDTRAIPMGIGTFGSRSLAVGGSAIARACSKIVDKGRKIAAHLMEAAVRDVEFEDGIYRVAGTDREKTIAEIAFTAYVPHSYPEGLEPGLDETAFYDPKNFTFPAGVHIAEVEIDPETGATELIDWVAVDDFGKVINPLIVEGQVQGGVAQGIGQAMLESCVYDRASGQLLTGSYNDYCLPRADDLPSPRIDLIETPCPHNPLGAKGCGEAGAIAAPPALINAVTDAIGIKHLDMPASPEKIWRALQDQQRAAS